MFELPRVSLITQSDALIEQVRAVLPGGPPIQHLQSLTDLTEQTLPSFSALIVDPRGSDLSPVEMMRGIRQKYSDLMAIVLLESLDPDLCLDLYSSGAFRCLPFSHLQRLGQILGEAGQHGGYARQRRMGEVAINADQRTFRVMYQDILEDQNELILRFRPDGSVVYANGAFCRFFGRTREDIVGQKALSMMDGEELAQFEELFAGLRPERPTAAHRHAVRRRDQASRWLEWTHRAIYSSAGRLAEYQSVGRDITDQVQAEQDLGRERNFYSTLIETTRAFVVILDSVGRLIRINPAAQQALGIPQEKGVGQYIWDLVNNGNGLANVSKERFDIKAGLHNNIPFEVRIPRPDGTWTVSLWWSSPVRGPDGAIENVISTGIDISEQKRTENELQALNLELENRVRERTLQLERASQSLMENQERLNRLLEVSPVVIYAASPVMPFTLQFISENLPQLIGYPLVEYLSKPGFFIDLIHPDDLEQVMQAYQSGIKMGAFVCEYRLRRKTGEYIWVQDEVNVNQDEQGRPQQLVGAFYDITKRKQAEEAARVSQERYRMLAEAAQDFIYVLSSEGIIEYMNGVTIRTLRVDPDDVLGHNLKEFFTGPITDGLASFIHEVLEAGEPIYQEHPFPMPDGVIWAGTWMAPFPIEHGEAHSVLAVSRDITEARRAEQELQHALEREKELSDLKTRFVSMTSHEFRTPLSTILSSAELLEHYGYKWTEQKKLDHLRKIQGAVKHLTALLEEVLVIGKADAGQMLVNPQTIDLAEFCASLVEEIQLGEGRFHPIEFIHSGETLPVITDPVLIRQILFNLLSNAVKYSTSGTPVIVALQTKTDWTEIEVSDQGMGFSAEDLPQLYQPFHRGKNVANIPGTGLGLAIVKRSLDLLGGEIDLESQEGVGTTIRVRIPCQPPESGDPDDPAAGGGPEEQP